jgi:Sigma-70, region 4
MTELDRLPPDQRAVLSLVLDRGKSYGEVAELLGIPEQTVRDRAHAALDAMANGPADPSGGQSSAASQAGSRPSSSIPRGSPPSSRPGGSHPHPSSPADPSPLSSDPASSASFAAGRGGGDPSLPPDPASPPPKRGPEARGPLTASSRTGGALLLAAIVAIAVAVAILISGGGGGKSSSKSSTGTSSNAKSTATASAGKPSLNKTIALTPLDPTLGASGTAYVLSQSGRQAFYVAARGLSPSSGFFYAVWLYNSPSSSAPLGRAPAVGSDGRMEGGGPLPTNASIYHQLIITRETSTHPRHPGPIELRGTFGLH